MWLESFRVALVSVACAFLWQLLNVTFRYEGNWTGLFCTGERQKVPAELLGESIYLFPASYGYDGQFYHYVAHDPLARTELFHYTDDPRLRYSRILVPGLAWLLALGHPGWIDRAYFAVILIFVFLGSAAMSFVALSLGRSHWHGLLFLFAPATAVAIDRMTVDVALTALVLLFLGLKMQRSGFGVPEWLVLASAPLTRETGLFLNATAIAAALRPLRGRRLILVSSSLIPFLLWTLYVEARFSRFTFGWAERLPFAGPVKALISPLPYTGPGSLIYLLRLADLLSIAGVFLGVFLALRIRFVLSSEWLRRLTFWLGLMTLLIAALGSHDIWLHVYNYGRVVSPLLIVLVLESLRSRRLAYAMPLLLSLPALAAGPASRALAMVRTLLPSL